MSRVTWMKPEDRTCAPDFCEWMRIPYTCVQIGDNAARLLSLQAWRQAFVRFQILVAGSFLLGIKV